jgi:hypothetical protein
MGSGLTGDVTCHIFVVTRLIYGINVIFVLPINWQDEILRFPILVVPMRMRVIRMVREWEVRRCIVVRSITKVCPPTYIYGRCMCMGSPMKMSCDQRRKHMQVYMGIPIPFSHASREGKNTPMNRPMHALQLQTVWQIARH